MNRFLWFMLTAVAMIAAFTGCSKNPAEPTVSGSTGLNLNTPTGGYTSSNEAPGFGDPSLDPSANDEKPFADPLQSSAQIDSMQSNSAVDWYHFRALWGHLRKDTAETEISDWSGSLLISRGALVVRRVIKFEDNDTILPRTDRRKVEWTSHTRPHHDGIAVDIFVPRPRPVIDTVGDSSIIVDTSRIIDSIPVIDTILRIDSSIIVDPVTHDTTITYDTTRTWGFHIHYDTTLVFDTTFGGGIVIDTIYPSEDASLTFSTPKYTRVFSLADLLKLDTIVTLEDSNEVAFSALRIYRNLCPRGFLSGNWGAIDSTGLGYFKGRWISKFGLADGYVEGHYGYNDDSAKVFFGKWIDSAGGFEGFLQGRWGVLGNRHHDKSKVRGWFAGQILDANMVRAGVLRGGFADSDSLPGGFMAGRWKLLCNDEEGDNPGGHSGQPRGGDGDHYDDDGLDD